MKVKLKIKLSFSDDLLAVANLDVEMPFPPSIIIDIEHPVWLKAHTPLSVSYNLTSEMFFVDFTDEDCENNDEFQFLVEHYRQCGWDVRVLSRKNPGRDTTESV